MVVMAAALSEMQGVHGDALFQTPTAVLARSPAESATDDGDDSDAGDDDGDGDGCSSQPGMTPALLQLLAAAESRDPSVRLADEYDVGRELGRGHSSAVRLARHRRLGWEVAIKTCLPGRSSADRATARELAALRAVREAGGHPHVCTLIDTFDEDGTTHLVLEYLKGGELFDRVVSAGRLSERVARRYVRAILRAVVFLHGIDILHRDLKVRRATRAATGAGLGAFLRPGSHLRGQVLQPRRLRSPLRRVPPWQVENVLLADDGGGRLKISDFGLSKQAPPTRPRRHTGCGTAGYAAPEILRRRPYDGRADVFSIGVIAYVLLTGLEPFTGANDQETARLTCSGDVDMAGAEWKDVTPVCMAFVKWCLIEDPDQRPTAVEALRHPWLRARSGQTSP